MTYFKLITILAAVSTITLTAAPALAQQVAQSADAIALVRTADLDLGTAAGRDRLDRRLERAAIAVCGEASRVDLAGGNAVRACRDETLARARAQRDQLLALGHQGPMTIAAIR